MAEVEDRSTGAPPSRDGPDREEAPATPSTAPVALDVETLPRGTAIRRYVVLDTIGAGAMGVVYAAYDRDLDRKIALKLVRDPRRRSSRKRLLREAKALAQLSHPSVVAVFDVGTYRDQVFLAMELVTGQTLRSWLRAAPRSRREVLEVYHRAGEGLAAAHAAGIVHRDFKPDNILIDQRGRVRVADFGLALIDRSGGQDGLRESGGGEGEGGERSRRAAAHVDDVDVVDVVDDGSGEPTDRDPSSDPSGDPSDSDGVFGHLSPGHLASGETPAGRTRALTATGMVLGTPAYMAPEQGSGYLPVDARADQYSFCVALYEGLCGHRPFEGADTELAGAATDGAATTAPAGLSPVPSPFAAALDLHRSSPPAPPSARELPARLHRVLARGLSAEPADRYPSMEALLADLDRGEARPRRRRALFIALIAGAVSAAAAAVVFARSQGEEERPCQGATAKLDGVWDRARKQAVQAAYRASGSPLAESAWTRVERTVDGWVAGWVAGHVDACEATHVRGEQSAALLDRRMDCLEQRRTELRALVDVLSAARLDPATVERSIGAAESLSPLAACADRTALGEEAGLPSDPATATKVTSVRGRLADIEAQVRTGKHDSLLAPARELAVEAGALGHRPTEADALLLHARLERMSGNVQAAEEILYRALTAGQAGRATRVTVKIWLELGWMVGSQLSRRDEGKRVAGLARGALERLGRDDELESELEGLIGTLDRDAGALAAARPHLERSLALSERSSAPDSQAVREAVKRLAILASLEAKPDESLRLHRRARTLAEKALGAEHRAMIGYLINEGTALAESGQLREALDLNRRALALAEKTVGVETHGGASLLNNIGLLQQMLGDHAGALRDLERALAVKVKLYGPDHASQADVQLNLANTLVLMKRYSQAIARFQRAAAIYQKSSGPRHPDVGLALAGLGEAHLDTGHPKRALPVLERSVAIYQEAEARVQETATARFALARVLWSLRRDRARARRLAAAARAGFEKADDQEAAGEVAAWLRSRR
jgi:serine/threonine protein kinase/tetratricopeptide (TPR) repeat protein